MRHPGHRFLALVILLLIGSVGLFAQSPDGGVRRFGLFLGVNDGGSERVRLRYAVSDASRVADVMARVGGIDSGDAFLLQEPTSRDIDLAVRRIGQQMRTVEARRVEFVLYYSGHSDERGLLLGDELYPYRALRDAIESVEADVAIAILDSCSSGSFTRLKGGRRTQPFLINNSSSMRGYAFLTSSSDDEASQESDEIGASFFTHYLVSGLLGAADSTRDGLVTLNEVYQYAFTETLSRTAATFAGPQHPAYEIQLTGAGDLILADLSQGSSRLVISEGVAGRVYLRDSDRGHLVAEFEKYRGETVDLALDPGRYQVEVRSGSGLAGTTVSVGAFAPGRVDVSMLQPVSLERNRIRGDEGALERIWMEASEAAGTVGSATRSAFSGVDPAAPSFVPADRQNLVREPFVLDLLPGRRLLPKSSVPEGESVHHLVLGVLAAEAGYTDGIMASVGMNVGTGVTRGWEWSYLGNVRRGRIHGLQQATVFNIHAGEVRGIQSSSVFNLVDGNVWGVQGAGVFNIVDGEVRGIQGSGVAGIAGGAVRGVQLGGVFAMSREIYGVQSAVVDLARNVQGVQLGVANIAEEVRGAQIGVLNIAEEVDGITLGLLNIVRFGVLDLAFTLDDRGTSWVAFSNGTEGLYTIYQLGMRQGDLETNDVEISSAAGLGTRVWSGGIYLDVDLSAMVQGTGAAGFDYRGPDIFPSLRVSGGLQLGPRFALMGGIRMDGELQFMDQDPAPSHKGSSFGFLGDGIRVYPHVFGGIKI